MISFRYHIVSIVAVFLALALGVVIGTTGLNGAILDDLHGQVSDLRSENNTLRADGDDLKTQVANGDKFATQYATKILAGTLTGTPVDIITTPGADSTVADKIGQDIQAAGGTVAARIELASAYVDPASKQKIISFVSDPTVHPENLTLPSSTDAGVLAAATLSFVLAGKGSSTDTGTVLSGMAKLGILQASDTVKAAKAAVIVTGGAVTKDDPRATPVPSLAGALSAAGVKTVVAGDADSATESGLVAAVRDDSTLNTAVSTVDDADHALGQVSTCLALTALQNGDVGHYGTAQKAQGLFPSVK